jgi:hypothetical protein
MPIRKPKGGVPKLKLRFPKHIVSINIHLRHDGDWLAVFNTTPSLAGRVISLLTAKFPQDEDYSFYTMSEDGRCSLKKFIEKYNYDNQD